MHCCKKRPKQPSKQCSIQCAFTRQTNRRPWRSPSLLYARAAQAPPWARRSASIL